VPDLRESPALPVMQGLIERGAEVRFVDPYIPRLTVLDREIEGIAVLADEELERADAIVVLTAHSAFDPAQLARHAGKLLDTRHFTGHVLPPVAVRST